MRYVIFTGGTHTPSTLTDKYLKQADAIIAADSGADTALGLSLTPSVVLGDFDSIGTKTKRLLEKKGVLLLTGETTLFALPQGHSKPLNPSEKDQTDTELAINYALQNGATDITIFGGSAGDRLDHILGNLFLTTVYDIPIRFVDDLQTTWLAKGPTKQTIHGAKGDLLSLIPIAKDVVNITSQNLYYPLNKAMLFFGRPRGISNVLTKHTATVAFTKGILLLVHTSHAKAE